MLGGRPDVCLCGGGGGKHGVGASMVGPVCLPSHWPLDKRRCRPAAAAACLAARAPWQVLAFDFDTLMLRLGGLKTSFNLKAKRDPRWAGCGQAGRQASKQASRQAAMWAAARNVQPSWPLFQQHNWQPSLPLCRDEPLLCTPAFDARAASSSAASPTPSLSSFMWMRTSSALGGAAAASPCGRAPPPPGSSRAGWCDVTSVGAFVVPWLSAGRVRRLAAIPLGCAHV